MQMEMREMRYYIRLFEALRQFAVESPMRFQQCEISHVEIATCLTSYLYLGGKAVEFRKKPTQLEKIYHDPKVAIKL